MEKIILNKRKRKRQRSIKTFNPNREFLEKAIVEFLANGGKITHIEENNYEDFMLGKDGSGSSTDEFLMGE